MIKNWHLYLIGFLFICCTGKNKDEYQTLNSIAESYVKINLVIGQYDQHHVDAYHGPEEWRPIEISEEDKKNFPADSLKEKVMGLMSDLNEIDASNLEVTWKMRHAFLLKHLEATLGKTELLSGVKMSFDEESKVLYDAIAPKHSVEELQVKLTLALQDLPGQGDVFERLAKLRNRFIVPDEYLDTLMQVTVNELRDRTLRFTELPPKEAISIEMVRDKPWGAYNWYQGNAQSLIQVNTDRPSSVSRLPSYLSHEVYPGHHTHLSFLDAEYAQKRGWVEFTIYPLYSPLSFIAEGIAEVGGSIVFPEADRLKFEKEVLMTMAGLDTNGYALYTDINKKIDRLTDLIRLEISRYYFDGVLSREEAVLKLTDILDYSESRAHQALDFVDAYGSYIINYSAGENLIRAYINKKVEGEATPDNQWKVFEQIISSPVIPSDLM